MKKIIILAILVTILGFRVKAQRLEVRDSAIVLVENGQESVLDSVNIEQKLIYVRKRINLHNNRLLLIEAKRAEELDNKSTQQDMLTYFLEIKYRYQQLRKKVE